MTSGQMTRDQMFGRRAATASLRSGRASSTPARLIRGGLRARLGQRRATARRHNRWSYLLASTTDRRSVPTLHPRNRRCHPYWRTRPAWAERTAVGDHQRAEASPRASEALAQQYIGSTELGPRERVPRRARKPHPRGSCQDASGSGSRAMKTVADRSETGLQVPARSRLVATSAVEASRWTSAATVGRFHKPLRRDYGNDEAQARNMLSPGLFCRDDRI